MFLQALAFPFTNPPERVAASHAYTRLARTLLTGMVLALSQLAPAAAQQSPAPTDEAGLYEAAKKEGKLLSLIHI